MCWSKNALNREQVITTRTEEVVVAAVAIVDEGAAAAAGGDVDFAVRCSLRLLCRCRCSSRCRLQPDEGSHTAGDRVDRHHLISMPTYTVC